MSRVRRACKEIYDLARVTGRAIHNPLEGRSRFLQTKPAENYAHVTAQELPDLLRAISACITNAFEREAEPLGAMIDGRYTVAALVNFGRQVMAKMKGKQVPQTRLVDLPDAATGEVITASPIALKKLVDNGGKIPDDIGSNGGNYGPVKGLRTA